MTLTDAKKEEYHYFIYVTKMGESRVGLVGSIFARHKEMPFLPECYGIFGMRQVVVFPLSMEVLR